MTQFPRYILFVRFLVKIFWRKHHLKHTFFVKVLKTLAITTFIAVELPYPWP